MLVATRASWFRTTRRAMCVCACLTVLVAAGCGGSSGPVKKVGTLSGKVTFNGAPVTEGQVAFIDQATGSAGGSPLGTDGTYKVPEALTIGNYAVVVQPPPLPMPEQGKPAPKPQAYANIPRKYHDIGSSGLTTSIKEGANTFDIDMKP